jgi:hypothetical protein
MRRRVHFAVVVSIVGLGEAAPHPAAAAYRIIISPAVLIEAVASSFWPHFPFLVAL